MALVLGAAVWADEIASPTLQRRARHAADLYLSGRVDHIIACGGLGKHPPEEAEVIRRICHDSGVPDQAISKEACSTTTIENIANALPLLQAMQRRDVTLVSDLYHTPRARMVARHFGLDADSSSPPMAGTHPLRQLKAALRELPALLLYAIRLR